MSQDDVTIEKGMLDLFCVELETQTQLMNDLTLTLEHESGDTKFLKDLVRAAHSIKGAARVVGLTPIVTISHALEDYFVALERGEVAFNAEQTNTLFKAIDAIAKVKDVPADKIEKWIRDEHAFFVQLAEELEAVKSGRKIESKQLVQKMQNLAEKREKIDELVESNPAEADESKPKERVLRVTAQNLSRLMGLAGESMVESRWLQPFGEQLMALKKMQSSLSLHIDALRHNIKEGLSEFRVEKQLQSIYDENNQCLNQLTKRLTELELFISRHSSLTDRLYSEVIDSRMRPFADGVSGFPRMVRDLSKQLGKEARLEIEGLNTPVDRDILDKLEAPLSHLLRNAVDHGIESPKEREKKGKPKEGLITLSAEHRGGMLAITVSDDGRGVDLESIKKKVVASNLAKGELAAGLTKQELLDFLFLPGFSTSETVTEISGRGMGLNIVQTLLQEVTGSMQVHESAGKGISFHMSLPLTLSVIRALTVEIAGEPYAFPLAKIDRSLLVPINQIEQIENRQYFNFDGNNIGIVHAGQVLQVSSAEPDYEVLPIVVLRDRENAYGLVVDSFLGERELVLQELDAKLGKVPNISAGAFMEDGAPVLIIDSDDIINSIDNLLRGGRLHHVKQHEVAAEVKKKRILVVDDSITVREVESRLLRNHGYEVETAVNGMDAWNAVRMGHYDLIITDIDMPRMNGIELVKMIKGEMRLKGLPVMIVSYKEREQDRVMGMEAGADYYMTKSSFHDETLLDAVKDLI